MINTERKLALFDLDGTLVSGHLWLGVVKYNFKNKKNRLAAFWYLINNLAKTPFRKTQLITTEKYYRSWGEGIAQMVKGIKREKAEEMFHWLADEYLLPTLKKNVLERLKKHQEEGFLTILTSGSFQELLQILTKRLNIDFALGTELEQRSNEFSGRIVPPLCFGQGKAEKIKKFLAEENLQVDFKESYAYSDSFFDLPTLEMVGNPVVVDPDKKLLEIAKNNGWQII